VILANGGQASAPAISEVRSLSRLFRHLTRKITTQLDAFGFMYCQRSEVRTRLMKYLRSNTPLRPDNGGRNQNAHRDISDKSHYWGFRGAVQTVVDPPFPPEAVGMVAEGRVGFYALLQHPRRKSITQLDAFGFVYCQRSEVRTRLMKHLCSNTNFGLPATHLGLF
jgi:hypothetical protein